MCVNNKIDIYTKIDLLEACHPSKESPLYVQIVHLTFYVLLRITPKIQKVQSQLTHILMFLLTIACMKPFVTSFESMLHEILIDEFKPKKINNDNVVCHEIMVEDCTQMLEAIRGLENEDCNLVMVGKRHNIGELTDEEMSNFMDNAILLGVFGDMLASTEFCNGKVPILVLQCGEKRVKQFEKVVSHVNTLF